MLNETQTSICNKALMLIGESPINNINDSTTLQARVCKEFFYTTLRSVFEEGEWPFATIETPAQRINIASYTKEQKYLYRIPGDCALVLDVYKRLDRKQARRNVDWDIRYIPELKTSAIICNRLSYTKEDEEEIDQDEQMLLKYISDVQSTYSYSAAFVRCVVAQLAADIAMPITHDPQKMQLMVQYAEQLKSKALLHALNEDKQDKLHWVDQFTASREGRIC